MDESRSSGWRRRGYLPHIDAGNRLQAITYRLADSVPKRVIDRWRRELADEDEEVRHRELRERIARYEDAGYGDCWLGDPENARIVADNLRHFDGQRYRLDGWCVMPNHVHVLIFCFQDHRLDQVVRSWKNYTARRINQRVGRSGRLWDHEYYDRLIRDERHLARARHYIRMNPVKAGLCQQPEDWRFGSASEG